jgi:hypothetical protein
MPLQQENSTVHYSESKMRRRNILWWEGALHVLDVGPSSPLSDSLLPDGLGAPVYTVDEADLGDRLVDVTYLHHLKWLPYEERLFVC